MFTYTPELPHPRQQVLRMKHMVLHTQEQHTSRPSNKPQHEQSLEPILKWTPTGFGTRKGALTHRQPHVHASTVWRLYIRLNKHAYAYIPGESTDRN
eukprot:559766-Amorphochlora_amoeboformis.AAC.2